MNRLVSLSLAAAAALAAAGAAHAHHSFAVFFDPEKSVKEIRERIGADPLPG